MPVLIVGVNCLSGVTTWADRLRGALADHPRYDIREMYIGSDESEEFDICVPTIEAADEIVRNSAPVIVVPNYMWDLFLTGFEPGVYCLGMCHADNEEQYYLPLSWYEPMISQFIAVSPECAKALCQRIPFRNRDIITLPYGIHVPETLCRNYQTKPLRLVYAGRVTELQKRVWDFVPLVDELLQANVPFEFDIYGDGDQLDPLRDAMTSRATADRVRFYGRIPHEQMSYVWSNHDVFIQVSDFEGTSVSMLEALAHGVVPVVTAASSGISGVIEHGMNGYVVPIGDMPALAGILSRLAAGQMSLATLGTAAHKTAQHYSMDSYSKQFVKVLDQIVQGDQELNIWNRYGMFAAANPLFKQHQLIARQKEQIAQQLAQIDRLQQTPVKRFLKEGSQRLFPTKTRMFLRNLRNQLVGR